jgi:peptidyl-prolyl cis-trans isomerase B (cyclophilin B)
LNGNKLRVFTGFGFIISYMNRGVFMKRTVVAAIAISVLLSPPALADEVKTSLDYCKPVKSVPHNPSKVSPQKNTSAKLPSSMTIVTNCGNIEIALAKQLAPVTISRLTYLAKNKFFDNSLCHRLTTSGIFVLLCGDPSGGKGISPACWKAFQDENLPTAPGINYPAGTVAMANRGPGTNTTQFFLVYKDTKLPPNYTIWGQVKSGLEILSDLASIGAYKVNPSDKNAYYVGDGIPIQPIEIRRVTTN